MNVPSHPEGESKRVAGALPRYAETLEAAYRFAGSTGTKKLVYGTIFYLPLPNKIDFGAAAWPPAFIKKDVCPRALLVSTWTDNRWGFVGGGVDAGESPLSAMNREFLEETGSPGEFSESDYCFSHIRADGTITSIYCKLTSDLSYFQSIMTEFHAASNRGSYIDEVIGICGMPLWIEGPELHSEISGKNNCWGLPRLLVGNGGAFTEGPFPRVKATMSREHFILALLKAGVLSDSLFDRVYELSQGFPLGPPLASREDMLRVPGVTEVLATRRELR